MDMENVPELLNGSVNEIFDLNDVDTILMKKPAVPGDTTERIKRRVRRQSSREGAATNGGGCLAPILGNHLHHQQKSVAGMTGGSLVSVPGISYFAPQRRWKNSRRSRNNSGHHVDARGLPKKGGAGGKGVWGLLGSELMVEEDPCDAQDPNYDSEANDAANTELCEVIAVPTQAEFYKMVEPVLLEYYECGDSEEAIRSLHEVMSANGAFGVSHYLISSSVELSMNHKDSHREMTSLLISDMYGRLVRTTDIERGFDLMLDNLDDLILDTPDAPVWLGNFIARAVADDCIPPRFVFASEKRLEEAEKQRERELKLELEAQKMHKQAAEANGQTNGGGEPDSLPICISNGFAGINGFAENNGNGVLSKCETLTRAALRRADSLLSLKTTMVHLDNIWGSAGPLRPVKNITKRMILLLREFIDSRDVAEAQRCLRALEVPHYHHELVYEAVVMALEAVGGQQAEEAMCELLHAMDDACLVSPVMMEQGFQRVYDDMTDIVLDVPLAYILLDRFVERCHAAGFLRESIVAKMPSRGRKRFVSEGDGGHIKPNAGRLLF